MVALGDVYAGLFGNDEDWIGEVRAAGEASGDHAWPLPHAPSVRPLHRVDLRRPEERRPPQERGGAIIAARFLQEFAGEGPWAHLDIAGTAYPRTARGDYYPHVGATGFGVRLLAELARRTSV